MKKLCTFGGCKEIIIHQNDGTSPRCTQHQPKQSHNTRKHYDHHFDDQGKNIYKSARWKKVRKAKMTINPLCERCLSMNRSTMAQMVDHIVEIEDGGDMYDRRNLQSLCNSCHNTKTGKERQIRNKKSDYPKLSDF